jgi:tRNA dimethylallyltransferase
MTSENASMRPHGRPTVVLLVGPTAVGKTEVSLQLAERLGAEIVSVDSRLFYRGLDIGTAKPTPQQRARVPHHLIDIVRPDETLSLVEFQRLAFEAIEDILGRIKLPLLVGGTGQYVRAVTAGWSPPAVGPQVPLRAELERSTRQHGRQWLHDRLRNLDPDAATAIDPRNARRTMRAIEVILTTGRRYSAQQGKAKSPYRLIILGLKRLRSELYARIDERIDFMWQQGLLDETRRLHEQGFGADLPAMSAIGYSQCIRVLRGDIEPEQARAEMRRATRAFVRRQANWFKDPDPEIHWFAAADPGVVDLMEEYIRRLLSVDSVEVIDQAEISSSVPRREGGG